MMNKLIKKQDKFILVSDEDAKNNEFLYNLENNTICRAMGDAEVSHFKIIAGVEFLPKIDFSLLKEEDCKTIGYIDVEKLACNIYDLSFDEYKYIREHLSQTRELITEHYSDFGRSETATKYFDVISFIDGSNYKETQSLNDKCFSLEDIITTMKKSYGIKYFSEHTFIKNLQSLQQTEWNVEIEMEEIGNWRHAEFILTGYIPKITNNLIKITKIL